MTAWPALSVIADEVRAGRTTAVALAQHAIAAVRALDPAIGAVTRLLEDRALNDAAMVDAKVAAGRDPGILAGVPFGVKDLFDVAGIATTAGSAIRAERDIAVDDAEAIRRLSGAGGVLVATLNMDEFAYGFATINAHYGTTRNPHDTTRLAGGSSGGSAAAIAGGMLPLTLGSDTNGSIRVPAALCGVYGLKPTHGTLPMAGVAPFAKSFDDIGPLAARLDDLLLAYHVLRGSPIDEDDGSTLRVARLGGWFDRNLGDPMRLALAQAAGLLAAVETELHGTEDARSAAFVMTAAEGGALHLPELARDALRFDPAVRDRLIAGALVPSSLYEQARHFRDAFAREAAQLFERFDVLLAPATGDIAPTTDDPMVAFEDGRAAARSHLGIFTQPLSFIGLPSLVVPLARITGGLPLGLQLISAPGQETSIFACARRLERLGLTAPAGDGDPLALFATEMPDRR